MHEGHWLIIADALGECKSDIASQVGLRRVLVTDGAYDIARQQAIQVDVLLGDFDSISPGLLSELRDSEAVKVVDALDQHKTDLEKALYFLQSHRVSDVIVVNALGGRMDHSLYNLRLLRRFSQTMPSLRFVTDEENIVFQQDCHLSLVGLPSQRVSVMGFPSARISSQGLTYDMQHRLVGVNADDSVSNSLLAAEASVDIQGSVLIFVENGIEISPFD